MRLVKLTMTYYFVIAFLAICNYSSFATSEFKFDNKDELLDVAAYVCTSKGLYKESNEILEKTLKLSLQNNDSLSIARYNNNLGVNYVALKKYDVAQKHFEKALLFYKNYSFGNEDNCAINNLGVLHFCEGKDEIAFSELKSALSDYNTKEEVNWSPILNYNLGEYYLQENKKDSAIECFFKKSECCEPGLNIKPKQTSYRLCYLIKEDNIEHCRSLNSNSTELDSSFFSVLAFYNRVQYRLDSLIETGKMESAYDLSVQKASIKEEIVKYINDKEYQIALASFGVKESNILSIRNRITLFASIIGAVLIVFSVIAIKRRKLFVR